MNENCNIVQISFLVSFAIIERPYQITWFKMADGISRDDVTFRELNLTCRCPCIRMVSVHVSISRIAHIIACCDPRGEPGWE